MGWHTVTVEGRKMYERSDGVRVSSTQEVDAIEEANKLPPPRDFIRCSFDDDEVEVEEMSRLESGIIFLIMIIILIVIAVTCSGCMRTDNHLEKYVDGELVTLHYTSNTSWATDSNLQKITIKPDGTIVIEGYEKREDGVKGTAIIGGVPVGFESVPDSPVE